LVLVFNQITPGFRFNIQNIKMDNAKKVMSNMMITSWVHNLVKINARSLKSTGKNTWTLKSTALMVSKFFLNKTWSTWIWELRTLFWTWKLEETRNAKESHIWLPIYKFTFMYKFEKVIKLNQVPILWCSCGGYHLESDLAKFAHMY
jgi:hypothetical protein